MVRVVSWFGSLIIHLQSAPRKITNTKPIHTKARRADESSMLLPLGGGLTAGIFFWFVYFWWNPGHLYIVKVKRHYRAGYQVAELATRTKPSPLPSLRRRGR